MAENKFLYDLIKDESFENNIHLANLPKELPLLEEAVLLPNTSSSRLLATELPDSSIIWAFLDQTGPLAVAIKIWLAVPIPNLAGVSFALQYSISPFVVPNEALTWASFVTFPKPTVEELNVAQVGAEVALDFRYYPAVPAAVEVIALVAE